MSRSFETCWNIKENGFENSRLLWELSRGKVIHLTQMPPERRAPLSLCDGFVPQRPARPSAITRAGGISEASLSAKAQALSLELVHKPREAENG